jgi:hypothetical protein
MITKPFKFVEGKTRLEVRMRCQELKWDLINEKGKELTIDRLREILERNESKTSYRSIMRWLKKGFFESRKEGKARLVSKESFLKFVDKERESREREIELRILRKKDRRRLVRMRRLGSSNRLALIGLSSIEE